MTLADAPAPACVHCHARLRDTELTARRWACLRCEAEAATHLRAIPGLFRRIDTLNTLVKGSSPSGLGGPRHEAPAPLRIAVLNVTGPGGAATQLYTIGNAWCDALGWPLFERPSSVATEAAFLTTNLRWACERYPDVAEDLRAISRIHDTLSSLDTGERQPRRIAVQCPCGTTLKITLSTPGARCPGCETQYGHAEVLQLPMAGSRAAA
ncbi:hypothetical protein ACFWM0_24975 [Streptomyces sp. NPDC058405]|uniref:hypothetical protein n=1 Tax=Streptomyces sp. NPDC058405 TaxID=3346482 RepID=UPI003648C67C